MQSRNCSVWVVAAAAFVLSVSALRAALPVDPNSFAPPSLVGQLLIATPVLRGPPFEHSVILVAQYNKEGAVGIVINRPLDRFPLAKLIAAFGADASGVTDSVMVYSGGPVDPEFCFVLHSADYRNAETIDVDGRVAITNGPAILRDIGLGKGPRKSLLALGYASWGPSQIDTELAHGVWDMMPEDPVLVFDDDRTKVWSDAMARYKSAH